MGFRIVVQRAKLVFWRKRRHGIFPVVLFSLLLILSSCKESSLGVIDPWLTPPKLLRFSATPTRVDLDSLALLHGTGRDTLEFTLTISATSLRSTEEDRLLVEFLSSDQLSRYASASFRPNEISVDSLKFSSPLTVSLPRAAVGIFLVKGTVVSASGAMSNSMFLSLLVVRSDRPPVISDLTAPDTVIAPRDSGQVTLLQLSIRASDPDGLQDIARVIFYSYKPDGTLANNGSPFSMYDDGGAGGQIGDTDPVAGDGVYTLTIQLPYGTQTGRYKFVFQAFDRVGEGSNTITHYITVQ
ncbi:MAG: hypothetical protein ACP5JH_01320 [Bacteroidota bacterium]